jgi:hypothetical protein
VAILSLVLSFIGRKVGDILLAVFGWSVTALFGRLGRREQLAVSAALALSIAWPIFVVGLLFPGVAGWALAFLPLQEWVGKDALRIAWAVLAIASPIAVGLAVHWAAPRTKGSVLRSAIGGYPLALGLFLSFLITAVTVPVLKIAAIVHGWTDTHVYVQPRVDRYTAVVRDLAEACARAGIVPTIAPARRSMTLAIRILRTLAGAAVRPIVSEDVVAIRGKDVELVVYPSDLLLRGEATAVARVRAMMTRTAIDADAFLVASAVGQGVQDELGRLRDVIRQREAEGRHVNTMADRRLAEIWKEMVEAHLPFEEWGILEAMALRIERTIVSQRVDGTLPLDRVTDELPRIAEKANVTDDVGAAGLALAKG